MSRAVVVTQILVFPDGQVAQKDWHIPVPDGMVWTPELARALEIGVLELDRIAVNKEERTL